MYELSCALTYLCMYDMADVNARTVSLTDPSQTISFCPIFGGKDLSRWITHVLPIHSFCQPISVVQVISKSFLLENHIVLDRPVHAMSI